MTAKEQMQFVLIVLVLVLCLFDSASTLHLMRYEGAGEMNPFMAPLIAAGPLKFVAIKEAITAFAMVLIWRYREKPLAQKCLIIAVGLYLPLMLWHTVLLYGAPVAYALLDALVFFKHLWPIIVVLLSLPR